MDSERIKILLEKYHSGTISPEEQEELDQWYETFDQQEDDLHLMYLKQHGSEATEERLYKQIAVKAGISRKKKTWHFRRVAAISLLVISVSVLLFRKDFLYNQLVLATNEVIEVPEGKLFEATLPDGSRVWLNAGSTLTYNRFFLGDKRNVQLEGEGFFNVSRNEKKPFIVHSGPYKVQVLGTSFNVINIPALQKYEVTVRSGKVQVSDSAGVLAQLLPKQRLNIFKGKAVPESVENQHYLAWTKGKLYFEDKPFREIAWNLEKRFGISIRFSTPRLQFCSFSGDFSDLSYRQVLKIMQEIHPFDIQYNKDESILISGGKSCSGK